MKTRTIIGPPPTERAKGRDTLAKQLSKLNALSTKQQRTARPSQWEIEKILKANGHAFPRTLAETDRLALQLGFSPEAVATGITTEEVLRVAMTKFAAITWSIKKARPEWTRDMSLAEIGGALVCDWRTARQRLLPALENIGSRYRINLALAGRHRQAIEKYLSQNPTRPKRERRSATKRTT